MFDGVRAHTKCNRQHVIERASSGVRLWVDRELPSAAVVVQVVHENGGFVVEYSGVTFDGGLVEPSGS